MTELTIHIAKLLGTNASLIKEIVEVENKIYVVSVMNATNEDDIVNYSYCEIDDSISEIPDIKKTPKKALLTEEEKTQYYLDNKKLIVYALKKINILDGIEFTELEGVGTYGFVKALNTFDKMKEIRFSTYAVKCILNEVYYYLRKEQKYIAITDSLDKEIAKDTNGNKLTIQDTISNTIQNKEKSTEEKILLMELRKTLLESINCLPSDEKYLTIYRYGLDNNIVKTQTEIAKILKMSQANISKLEKVCLKKLRTILKRNNYSYDSKTKTLDGTGLPIFDLLVMDDSDNYLDRNSRENIEIGICTSLNMSITDINDIKTTNTDHTFLITFNKNNRVGVFYNTISNKYSFTALPLTKQDKFLYLVLNIPLKTDFNKNDLLDERYNVKISDIQFKEILKSFSKEKQYILINKYGLLDNKNKLVSEIATDLKMDKNKVLQLNNECLLEFKEKIDRINEMN